MVNPIIREITVPNTKGKTSDTVQGNGTADFEQILEEELAKTPQTEQLLGNTGMLFYWPVENIITPVSKMEILADTMQVQVDAPVSQAVANAKVQETLTGDTGQNAEQDLGRENPAETLLKPNGTKDVEVGPNHSQTNIPQEGIQPETTAKKEQKVIENVIENVTDHAATLQTDTSTRTTVNAATVEKNMSAKEPIADYATCTPDKLNEHITKMIQSGKRQIEIQLQPEHLGKLVIKASYEAGKAMVAIVCTDTKTMNIMNQNASELADIIAARTGRSTEVVVDNAPVDYLEHQSQNQQEREGTKQDQRDNRDNRDKKQSGTTDFLQHLRLGLV